MFLGIVCTISNLGATLRERYAWFLGGWSPAMGTGYPTFRTVKYIPNWPPKGFESLSQAREWVQRFVEWYNTEHRHSALNYVTPAQRYNGEDRAILKRRQRVLETARAGHPNRWSGSIRNCEPMGPVTLNPDAGTIKESEIRKKKLAS